jgi:hypothetical protein
MFWGVVFPSLKVNPVVRQGGERETYYVRENTPIAIYLSKKADGIDVKSREEIERIAAA